MLQRPVCDSDTPEFKSFPADGSCSFTSSHPFRILRRQKGLSRLIQKAMSSVCQPCDYIIQTVVSKGLTPWLLICQGELITQPSTLRFLICASCYHSGRQDYFKQNKYINHTTITQVPQWFFSRCSKCIESTELPLGLCVWVICAFPLIDERSVWSECVLPSDYWDSKLLVQHTLCQPGITSIQQKLKNKNININKVKYIKSINQTSNTFIVIQ